MENDIIHTLLSFINLKEGNVIMVTSCHRGAGATYCTHVAAETLHQNSNKKRILVLSVSANDLKADPNNYADQPVFTIQPPTSEIVFSRLEISQLNKSYEYNINSLGKYINKEKEDYDLVFIDCSAISQESSLYSLLSVTQGVLLVVAAGSTRRPVITSSINTIQRYEGNVIATILNKRQFYIPKRIYKCLF